MIAKYAKIDSRVKHYSFTENLGIAGNSNQILEKVEGEFIALLDHDDTLSPDALYENAKLLNEKPYDFIYSDKDKIDEKGNRFDPLFKPELSPEMLLNINYLTHLNVMRTSIVREIGGWDPNTDGAQDWDLFLRVVDKSKYVGFIPKVLYHWRVIATSTAMSIETKPYALANQCKTVDKYLAAHGVHASAYVEKTELFLKWDDQKLDHAPLVFIQGTSMANIQRTMRKVRSATQDARFVILVNDKSQVAKLGKALKATVLASDPDAMMQAVKEYVDVLPSSESPKSVLFLSDIVHVGKTSDWYARLTGWLTVPGVALASGRLVNNRDLIVSSGAVVTQDGQYFPLFQGYPRYYQSYVGNAEWVRNLTVVSPALCATDFVTLRAFIQQAKKQPTFDEYCLWVNSQEKRVVMSPHATEVVASGGDIESVRPLRASVKKDFHDPYSNPNMAPHDPLRLFDDEELTGVSTASEAPLDMYSRDAAILADTFDITAEQMAANKKLLAQKRSGSPRSVAWFLPGFDAVYAGLMNIFSFADYLLEHEGIETTVYVLKAGKDASDEKAAVVKTFPAMANARFVALQPNDIGKIKPHDLGIATQWATTFPLAKAAVIGDKHYFIQDNEANFYPKGSVSALVELSYQFGFKAIAGTEGLLNMYRKEYGGNGIVLGSKVDLSAYHSREDMHYTPKKPYKVFFYARPNMPRNAFELGVAGLKRLKQELGDNVEIITAGAQWDATQYGVEGMFTNLGKIAYEAVPKLYRSVDAGLMFMFSGHPGVTASELMASGCPVVVNEYDDVTWHELYQHEKTCLITAATASEVAHSLQRCLTDTELRKKLIVNGLKKSQEFYSGYEESRAEAARTLLKS